jgi:gluconolactonase
MVKSRPSDFRVAATRIAARLGAVVALCVGVWVVVQLPSIPAIGAALHGHDDPDDRYIERIGSPVVVYDVRAYRVLECEEAPCDHLDDNGLDYNIRIEVLDSGLIEGRGLAYDGDRARLIIADAWEGLYGYWPDSPGVRPDRLPWIRVCPGGRCQDVDHRGLAYDSDASRIVVTDYHQHRLALRLPSGEFDRSIGGNRLIDGVTDVALAERGAFFVSATGEGSGPSDSGRPAGAVYHVTDSDAQTIVTGLQRPIGLAFSPCQQRLYIADSTSDGLTLYFFSQDAQSRWQRAGVLATIPTDRNAAAAPLSGMAVVACRSVGPEQRASSPGGELFVAGPGGLFLFHPDGTLLAKFVLNERVTGLAWDEWVSARHDLSEPEGHQLYMTVGHRVARLHTTIGPEPLSTRRPRPTAPATGTAAAADSPGPSAPDAGTPRTGAAAVAATPRKPQ